MEKNEKKFFVPKNEKDENLTNAFKILSEKKLIDIKGGTSNEFEEDEGSDWKNYAESTSYNRNVTYAKLRVPSN